MSLSKCHRSIHCAHAQSWAKSPSFDGTPYLREGQFCTHSALSPLPWEHSGRSPFHSRAHANSTKITFASYRVPIYTRGSRAPMLHIAFHLRTKSLVSYQSFFSFFPICKKINLAIILTGFCRVYQDQYVSRVKVFRQHVAQESLDSHQR